MTNPESTGPTAEQTAAASPDASTAVVPTPEQRAERARLADKATRRALAAVLGLEALVTLLVPRALAFTDAGLGTVRTVLLLVLAGLMLIAAGLLRRPFGIGAGSALQLLFVLTGVMLIPMFVIGVIFAAVWGRLLLLRRDLVGTPGGVRILVS